MELRQLRYFISAARNQNFTRAGAEQFITESGLQRQIRNLERELRLPLFEKSGRSVRLTSAGQRLLEHAERLAVNVRRFEETAADIRSGDVGLVIIGCYPVHIIRFLAPVVGSFMREHPGIRVKFGEHPGDQIVEGNLNLYDRLQSGHVDFAIGPLRPPWADALEIYTARGIVILDDTHPARNAQSMKIETLRDQPLVCLPRGLWFRSRLEEACNRAGFRPEITLETTVEALMALTEEGFGAGVFSDDNLSDRAPHFPVLLDVDGRPLEAVHWLQWNKDAELSPAATTFLEFVRDFVSEAAVA